MTNFVTTSEAPGCPTVDDRSDPSPDGGSWEKIEQEARSAFPELWGELDSARDFITGGPGHLRVERSVMSLHKAISLIAIELLAIKPDNHIAIKLAEYPTDDRGKNTTFLDFSCRNGRQVRVSVNDERYTRIKTLLDGRDPWPFIVEAWAWHESVQPERRKTERGLSIFLTRWAMRAIKDEPKPAGMEYL